MTMPVERARALRWAAEFMKEVRSCKEAPAHLREQAHRILRHYPEAHEIESQARHEKPAEGLGPWLAPEDTLKIN